MHQHVLQFLMQELIAIKNDIQANITEMSDKIKEKDVKIDNLTKENEDLKNQFNLIHKLLVDNESTIISEFNNVQGVKVELGGYYNPDTILSERIMKPSSVFNKIISTLY